jgi:Tat protein secretion system quality control protein TatD with DNase activity
MKKNGLSSNNMQHIKWLDTHTHLFHLSKQYLNKPDEWHFFLNQLMAHQTSVLDICTSMHELPDIIAFHQGLCDQGFQNIGRYTVGIHPMYADCDDIDQQLSTFDFFLANLAQTHATDLSHQSYSGKSFAKCVAIGEIGIDFKKTSPSDLKQQIYVFETQLNLMQKHQCLYLPVILHMPKQIDIALALLKKYQITKVIFHGYSASLEQAQKITKAGYFLGLGTLMFNLQSHKMQQVLQHTQPQNWVLETDAPYMQNFAKKMDATLIHNSLNIKRYADYLSQIKNISTEDLQQQLAKNHQFLWPDF